jgi:heme-degrading monooxygenase HmoA
MVAIAKDNNVITVIVHFTVEPSRQAELADSIVNYLETYVKQQPGFISASLHKSLDGKRVVNYAQWQSQEDFQAFIKWSQAESLEPEIFQIFHPDGHIYEVHHQSISVSS